jgi:hypothetical protein
LCPACILCSNLFPRVLVEFASSTAKSFRPHVAKAAYNLLRRFLGLEKDVITAAEW